MDKYRKHQVFISSTQSDLINERNAVMKELLNINCIPAAMEFFQPINKNAREIIEGILDNCDYLVLILAGRYGSTIDSKPTGKSFTQLEYEYAKKKGIPVIPFLLSSAELEKIKKSGKKGKSRIDSEPQKQKSLMLFRRELERNATLRYYKSVNDLSRQVGNAVTSAMMSDPRDGWVKSRHESGWTIISSVVDKDLQNQKSYDTIIKLFKKGKGLSNRLKLAFPLTKRLLETNKRTFDRALKSAYSSEKYDAISSKFYYKNPHTKKIQLHSKWDGYDLLYAMCYVSEHRLHTEKLLDNYPFDNINWADSPWDDVALYISQICSDEGFERTIKMVNRSMQQLKGKKRFEGLLLIYRMIMSRPKVSTDLLYNLFKEISYYFMKRKS